jgi:hypothetical protein
MWKEKTLNLGQDGEKEKIPGKEYHISILMNTSLIVVYRIYNRSSVHYQNPREYEANFAGNHLLDKPNMPVR